MLLLESESYPFALKGSVPLEPGRTKIPSGHIRLFHYTAAGTSDESKFRAAEALRKNGILFGKAKGVSYGEPNQVWASTTIPDSGKVFAEFSVHPKDERIVLGKNSGLSGDAYSRSGWDMTFSSSIRSKEIVAVHEPWHGRYRYLLENPSIMAEARSGELDYLLDTAEYGPAIYRAKNKVHESVGAFEAMLEKALRRSTINVRRSARLRSYREEISGAAPYGAVSRDELKVEIPSVLYHATPFGRKILSNGFKSRLGSGEWVLGGGSDESVSFTSSLQLAKDYANGLRVAIKAASGEIDPRDEKQWAVLLRSHGYNPYPITSGILQAAIADQNKYRYKNDKLSFEVLQRYSFWTRKFPLFMGGSWPESIRRAKSRDVLVLEIDTDGPEWWSHHPGEKEFRIYDAEKIDDIRVVRGA